MLLEDSLRGVGVVRELDGPIVDVGSGGGAPGIPLAAALPDRKVTLLEAERRKVDFLGRWTERLPNLEVVWGRAEEQEILASSTTANPSRSLRSARPQSGFSRQ